MLDSCWWLLHSGGGVVTTIVHHAFSLYPLSKTPRTRFFQKVEPNPTLHQHRIFEIRVILTESFKVCYTQNSSSPVLRIANVKLLVILVRKP
ncbi:hypothetical protein L1987_59112 [Smallanthus sonchifolius]|uniref:Uncharacterized protein n=1 Tax=Smallanthus sonchifolius TaxID=185202 RepID=A0ACB9D4D1_9ASTR|nr:hypothetical protein L1987_59112 [Smallanthus sonchifolius]